MAKYLKQFRYYGEGSSLNSPLGSINRKNLATGSIFFNSSNLTSIAALGIQTLPGVKFYLNDSVDSIIIGSTGVFELNLASNYEVTSLRFDTESLNLIGDASNGAYLIVDIVYNTEG